MKQKFLILVLSLGVIDIFFIRYSALLAIYPTISQLKYTHGYHSFFLSDLLSANAAYPFLSAFLFSLICSLFIYFLSSRYFCRTVSLALGLTFLISPWVVYSEQFNPTYLVLTSLSLALILSLVSSNKGPINWLLFFLSAVSLVYLSFWGIIFCLIFIILNHHYFFSSRKSILMVFIFVLFLGPLAYLALNNKEGFINIFHQEVKIFSEVGLLNAVNVYRGEANQTQLAFLGRIIENKVTYYGEHLVYLLLKHISPGLYFSQQVRVYGLTTNPPLFFGFIIPFSLGLLKIIKKDAGRLKPFLPYLLALLLPSLMASPSPDLFKLLLILPALLLIIGYGFETLLTKSTLINSIILTAIFILVLIQSFITIYDIASFEEMRMAEIFK